MFNGLLDGSTSTDIKCINKYLGKVLDDFAHLLVSTKNVKDYFHYLLNCHSGKADWAKVVIVSDATRKVVSCMS